MDLLDWKSYEELTTYLYEQIGQCHGVKIVGHGNDCKYKGKSGVYHQIDVLTSHSDGFHEYLTDIECKYWDQHINKDTVMKVHSIVEDCNFAKGIVVSKLGFTPDAIAYAKSVGVGLVELREITDSDWKNRIKYIKTTINVQGPELLSLNVDAETYAVKGDKESAVMHINAQRTKINYPNGDSFLLSDYLENGFMTSLEDKEHNIEFQETFDFPNGTRIEYEEFSKSYDLRRITAIGIFHDLSLTHTINGEDHILYIMKFVFEGKTFTVDKNRKIREEK